MLHQLIEVYSRNEFVSHLDAQKKMFCRENAGATTAMSVLMKSVQMMSTNIYIMSFSLFKTEGIYYY